MTQSKSVLDTIVAVATPQGRGGVGVIRVSGEQVQSIAQQLLGKVPTPRMATLTHFKDADQKSIDKGLALFFPKPNSFTAEDVLELHAHGGPVIMQSLLEEIVQFANVRQANPGEFSQRAFLNNKIDLVQAEAIADLIDSQSKTAARAAVRSLQGDFSNSINQLVKQLIELRMFVESSIDFPEEDIEFIEKAGIEHKLQEVARQLDAIYDNAEQGRVIRDGISMVILGVPNVGKSSLLNVLAKQDVAIVTHLSGTTRDVLQHEILIDDIPVHIIDTAGVCESNNLVEQEGIRRTWQQVAQADVILIMQDASCAESDAQHQLYQQLLKSSASHIPRIIINNKIDLVNLQPQLNHDNDKVHVDLSVKKNLGIELLKNAIKKIIGIHDSTETTHLARKRHLDALVTASQSIQQGLLQLKHHQAIELLAEDLRVAQHALSEITGEFSSDDLLGEIFSHFCIGK